MTWTPTSTSDGRLKICKCGDLRDLCSTCDPKQTPCECLLVGPTNESCPHHGSKPWTRTNTFDKQLDDAVQKANKGAAEFCLSCGAGLGKFRRTGEGTCHKCDVAPNDCSKDTNTERSKTHKDGSACYRVFYRVACEECGYPISEARFSDWTDYSEFWESRSRE